MHLFRSIEICARIKESRCGGYKCTGVRQSPSMDIFQYERGATPRQTGLGFYLNFMEIQRVFISTLQSTLDN